MNTKLLRKIQKQIIKYPKAFLMESFVEPMEFDKDHPCGTAACIAGWACILEKDKLPQKQQFNLQNQISGKISEYDAGSFDFYRYGREFIEISKDQADKLFDVTSWPEQFWEPYYSGNSDAKNAKIAVERIEHFIKTGE